MSRLIHADYHWRTQSRGGWHRRIKMLEEMLQRFALLDGLTIKQQVMVIDAKAEIKLLQFHLKVQK